MRYLLFRIGLILLLGATYAQPASNWEQLNSKVYELLSSNRPAEALPIAEQAVAVASNEFGTTSSAYASSLDTLGYVYMMLARFSEAEAKFRSARSIQAKAVSASHPEALRATQHLIGVLLSQGRPREAESIGDEMLQTVRQQYGSAGLVVANCFFIMGQVYQAEQRYSDAQIYLGKTLTIQEKELPPMNAQIAQTLAAIGAVKEATGEMAGAIAQFIRVYGYLHTRNVGNEHVAEYKTEVIATRIKYLEHKK